MIGEIQSLNGFFLQILNEYIEFKEIYKKRYQRENECFIYRYMGEVRRKKALLVAESKDSLLKYSKNKRKNKYVLLEAMETAREKGLIGDDDFVRLFIELTGEKGFVAGDRKLVEKYKFMFLCGCIDDYFINKGYSVKTGKELPQSNGQSADTMNELEMWSEFCQYANVGGTGEKRSALTKEFEKECTTFFNSIIARDDISIGWLPLYFDSRNGAGIYIVSKEQLEDCLEDDQLKKLIKELGDKKNYVCVTSFYFFCPIDDANFSPLPEDADEIFLQNNVWTSFFSDIPDAFCFFKDRYSMFFQHYIEYNDCKSKSAVTGCYSPFFDITKPSGTPKIKKTDTTEEILKEKRKLEILSTKAKMAGMKNGGNGSPL